MKSSTHPVEKEELMAYFDGELPVERAAVVAAHLQQCTECTVLAADLNSVSEQLGDWHVEPSPERLSERVTAALEARPLHSLTSDEKKSVFPVPAPPVRLARSVVLGLAGGVSVLVVVGAMLTLNLLRPRLAPYRARSEQIAAGPYNGGSINGRKKDGGYGQGGDRAMALQEFVTPPSDTAEQAPTMATAQPSGPMIARTAALTLVTKEFDNARATLEAVVRQHQGYTAQLTVTGHAGTGRTLAATLRVPSSHLDALLAELKKLGRVEQESQGGEEVTRQYVDLGARLSNARNTEQRLIEVLRQRTGRVADILAVENEISRVRGDIESMEAERKTLENRVQFAALELRLNEEYKAQIEVAPPSTATRLHNAMAEGYRSAVESALWLLLFLLSYAPSLALWGLLLLWPARMAWRRLRPVSGKARAN